MPSVRSWSLIALLVVAACGDSGTEPLGPKDLARVQAALQIVGGDAQRDTIQATLRDAITVQLMTAQALTTEPLVGVVVNFVVTDPGCGRPFAGSAATDATGRAAERWQLGTKAGTCTMEVRAVDADGTARVLNKVTATVSPGIPASVQLRRGAELAYIGDTINVSNSVTAKDRAGNDAVGSLLSPPPGLTGDGAGRFWASEEKSASVPVVVQGKTQATVQLTWLRDLRKLRWSTRFDCRGGPSSDFDSVTVTLASEDVTFSAPVGFGGANTAGTIWFSGNRVEHRRGGDVTVPLTHVGAFFLQTVGQLEWGLSRTFSKSSESVPTRYTGGSLCPDEKITGWSGWRESSPLELAGR